MSQQVQFQRRHFQFIADILKDMNADSETAQFWADNLSRTNGNFQVDKFLKACGVTK